MTSTTNGILVTVAIPVYNEEQYIRNTLESVINQDYGKLEILISDNASTDNTGSICQEYAARDKRIHYFRQNQNIGIAKNFFHLTQEAKGDYFVWIAGHDAWSTNLISECVKLLENNPNATVAYGTPVWKGEKGEQIQRHSGWYDTQGCNPVARFFSIFWGSMNPILGVIRRGKLPVLKQKYTFVGADLVLLADLALKGEFIHATHATFYRCQNRPAENYPDKLQRYKSKDIQISSTYLSSLFPLAKLPYELLRTVIQSKISFIDKICITILLIPSLPLKYILGKRDHKQS